MITWNGCKNTINYLSNIIDMIKAEKVCNEYKIPILNLYTLIKSNTNSTNITLDLNLRHTNLKIDGVTDLLKIDAVINEDVETFKPKPNYVYVRGEIFGDIVDKVWNYVFYVYDNEDYVIHKIDSKTFKSIYLGSTFSELYVAKQIYDDIKDRETITEADLLKLKNSIVNAERLHPTYLTKYIAKQVNDYISDFYQGKEYIPEYNPDIKIDFTILNKKRHISTIYPTI